MKRLSTPAAAARLADIVDMHAGDFPIVSLSNDGQRLSCMYGKLCFDVTVDETSLDDEVELQTSPYVAAKAPSANSAFLLIGLVEAARQKTNLPLVAVDCR